MPTINYKPWTAKLEMACCFTFFLLVHCGQAKPESKGYFMSQVHNFGGYGQGYGYGPYGTGYGYLNA